MYRQRVVALHNNLQYKPKREYGSTTRKAHQVFFMDKYTIYKIAFPNGKCYIGQTSKHEYIRWGQHLNECGYNIHNNKSIQAIYDEYGYDDWVFEVLQRETSDDKSYIHLLEQHYVDKNIDKCVNRVKMSDEQFEMNRVMNDKKRYKTSGTKSHDEILSKAK